MRGLIFVFVLFGAIVSPVFSAPRVELRCVAPVVIVGVTSSLHNGKTGGVGGLWSMQTVCDAEFPGSRMCPFRVRIEVFPPYPPLPTLGAWIDGVLDSCIGWSFDRDQSGIAGAVLLPGGKIGRVRCDQFRPILCCEQPSE